MRNSEKRFIPGTNPEWGRELPDEDDNSLVDKNGRNWDNGYNFDEKNNDDCTDEANQVSYDNLSKQVPFNPTSATEARQEVLKPEEKSTTKDN